jgi:actin related protein 2/3 complex subunit 2
MLLLEYHNKIIEDTLLERFDITDGKFESVEATIADFDAVTFHLFTDQNQKNLLNISISIKCFSTLRQNGVDDVLKKQYGNLLVTPEQGFDVTLQVNTAQPPQDKGAFARNIALLKRHCFAAPFYKVFADIEAKKPGALVEVPYRDDESFFIKPETDRCIVIFSIAFKDTDDIVLAKTFLQEYADARKTMSNAPSVSYAQKEPPLELRGVRNLRVGEAQGFVSFVLFQPHMAAAKKEKTIDNIQTFRNYLHYHLKCSKAFLHTRMRNRVRTFLQVLNRAKSEPENKEKKTITGRTFKRADDAPAQLEQEYNI